MKTEEVSVMRNMTKEDGKTKGDEEQRSKMEMKWNGGAVRRRKGFYFYLREQWQNERRKIIQKQKKS